MFKNNENLKPDYKDKFLLLIFILFILFILFALWQYSNIKDQTILGEIEKPEPKSITTITPQSLTNKYNFNKDNINFCKDNNDNRCLSHEDAKKLIEELNKNKETKVIENLDKYSFIIDKATIKMIDNPEKTIK